MALSVLKKFIPQDRNGLYILAYNILTFSMIFLYIFVYLGVFRNYGKKYLPLVVTVRTIVLGLFLIWFYNPFRSKFEYGRALPVFAGAAGLALLLSISKYDFLNLVHFSMYWKMLPPQPECSTPDDGPFADNGVKKTK